MITFSNLGNMGRMSNQMFQIAATISLAYRNNDKYVFPPWHYEPYFNLHNCFSTTINPTKTYTEPHFHYSEIPHKNTTNEVLDLVGYWQSWRYWNDYQDIIRNLLTPIHHFEKEIGLCSIHIRRGDYINKQDCHPLINMDYYRRAIQVSGCSKFLIFSDDISWAKNNFVGHMFEFSENIDPTIDLALMAKKCEHNIICNSSFSWWGAYLNRSENKKVIAPQKWFGPTLPHNTKDLLPHKWIVI